MQALGDIRKQADVSVGQLRGPQWQGEKKDTTEMDGIKWNLIQIQKELSDHSSVGQAWISFVFLPDLL